MLKTQLILLTAFCAFMPFSIEYFNIIKTSFDTVVVTADMPDPYFDGGKDNRIYRIKKVVIDPGHGGHDGGCSGSASTEKHIALAIAKKMKAAMERQHPDVQVILTRDRDIFIPLHKRAAIANQAQADLFISVHCNSISTSKINGSETYVLGTHKLEENLAVAKRENAAVLFEDNYQKTYNFDPNSNEGHITMTLYQNAYLEQSLLFADRVEANVKAYTPLRSRGVKQAGFLVLRETTMPSVLFETGYLTNGNDQKYLMTVEGQKAMAAVVTRAFTEYRNIIENNEAVVSYTPTKKSKSGGTPYRRQATRSNTRATSDAVLIAPQTNTPASQPTQQKVSLQSTSTPHPTVQYRVQLAASNKALDLSKGRWLNIPDKYTIEILNEDGMKKYQARGFYSFVEAEQARRDLTAKGFKGAWIVAYKNGEKITVQKAKAETGEL